MPSVAVDLSECVGRILAKTTRVVRDVPHYDSSAMDGFAVSGPPPWQRVEAGTHGVVPGVGQPPRQVPDAAQGPAEVPDAAQGPAEVPEVGRASTTSAPDSLSIAQLVATGMPVPAWAHSVVRQEWVAGDPLALIPGVPTRDLAPGRNIRRAGREARAGEVVAVAGSRLGPAQVAFAAVAGHDWLPVVRPPRVGLLFTGAEVVSTGLPPAGRVRDAFGPQLPAYVRAVGGEVAAVERIGDDLEETRRVVVGMAGECDVLISTGGTGHSHVDQVRRVAVEAAGAGGLGAGAGGLGAGGLGAGAEAVGGTGSWQGAVFTELNMRPGHPTFLIEHSGLCHVGLPGNPLAAMVAFRVVVAPLLWGMMGVGALGPVAGSAGDSDSASDANLNFQRVVLAQDYDPGVGRSGAGGSPHVVPARPNGEQWELCDKRGSNMLRGLAEAQGLVIIPATGTRAGDAVCMLPLPL